MSADSPVKSEMIEHEYKQSETIKHEDKQSDEKTFKCDVCEHTCSRKCI